MVTKAPERLHRELAMVEITSFRAIAGTLLRLFAGDDDRHDTKLY
jgi:hypothetical protein